MRPKRTHSAYNIQCIPIICTSIVGGNRIVNIDGMGINKYSVRCLVLDIKYTIGKTVTY